MSFEDFFQAEILLWSGVEPVYSLLNLIHFNVDALTSLRSWQDSFARGTFLETEPQRETGAISYLESSSLTAHAGLTRRATLESSV